MGSGCRHMSTRWRFLFFLEWRAATSKRSWSVILGSSSAKKNSVQVIPDTERERERRERDARECSNRSVLLEAGTWHVTRMWRLNSEDPVLERFDVKRAVGRAS